MHYLEEHDDPETRQSIAALFAPGARVVDEGLEYAGSDAIRGWLDKTGSAYTYTTTLLGQRSVGEGRWIVLAAGRGTSPAESSTCAIRSPSRTT